jgi:hypothetical protein
MRIVSLNAWGGTMFDQLTSWLPGWGADVLCLQEVTRTPGEDGWTSFSDAERELPQRANLFRDVCHLLDRHQGSFVASDAGPVIGGGGILRHQDFGLAVFVDERFPVVGQVTDFVHGSFVDHQAWPSSGRPRLAQGIRLIDRRDQRSVAVVHVHGTPGLGRQDRHPCPSPAGAAARRRRAPAPPAR